MAMDAIEMSGNVAPDAPGGDCPDCGSVPRGVVPRVALSTAEAAQSLSISQGSVKELIYQGKLGCVKLGRRVLVPVAELEEFIRSNTTHGTRTKWDSR
jgi:excisionase family DNA binding protein